MVAAVRAAGRPAWHLLGQNEGHGFAKKENQDYQFLGEPDVLAAASARRETRRGN